MRFELEPPAGVGPVRIGMQRDDAGARLRDWGTPEPFVRGRGPLGWRVQRPATVFVYCNEAGFVEAVEFGSPSFGEPADNVVVFRDIDVFATPDRDVVARLRAAGIEVEESEGGYSYTAPELLLAFWRDCGPEDEDEMPLYFESVLLAAPGYYER